MPAARAPAAATSAAEGNAAFGVDLYKRLAGERGNVFISPVSIAGAFGPVAAGARGETRSAIERALRFPGSGEKLHAELGGMLRGLERSSDGVTLSIANALWVKQGFALKPEFSATARKHYDATAETLDFAGAPDRAAKRINKWADVETRGRIKEIFSADAFGDRTALVVTNAVYFLGDWAVPFPVEGTRNQPFYRLDGSERQVPMMTEERQFRYFETESFQAIHLPYKDPQLSMTVFLPKARDGLPAFERKLDENRLRQWLAATDDGAFTQVKLFLPKLELNQSYQLAAPLQELGMGIAFVPGSADFRGISDEELSISAVIQKTFLRIDEKGTEAVAVTATETVITGVRIPRPPVIFRADHPFFFVLRDRESGAILFLGRIEDPTAKAD